jgi:hypothetical protein
MDVSAKGAVLYSSFDSIYSTGFGGSKAIDYHCALHSSPAHATLCLAMRADDLDLSMKTFDQIFRRLARYLSEKYHEKSDDRSGRQPVRLVVLMDESEVDNAEESSVADYEGRVQSYLAKIWEESDSKVRPALHSKYTIALVLSTCGNLPMSSFSNRSTSFTTDASSRSGAGQARAGTLR